MTMYIGLDVHGKRTVFEAQLEDGRLVSRGEVATSRRGMEEMLRLTGAESGARVGMETGAMSFWLSDELSGLGLVPFVIDAGEVRQKSRRPNQKCDRRDAQEICSGLRRGIYDRLVFVPDRELRSLRRLLTRRRHLVGICVQEVNAVKSLLAGEGRVYSESLTTEAAWVKLVKSLSPDRTRELIELQREVWRSAAAGVSRLEEWLPEAVGSFRAVFARLQTVPGVGPITAATFIAVIGRPDRFAESGQVVSYVGLCASSWDTGERVVHGPITKRGNSELRMLLVEAAQHANRPSHPLYPYFARMMAKHGYQKAAVCVAQRLSRVLHQMWLHDEDFKVEKLNVVKSRRVKRRVYDWRLKTESERARA